MNKHVSNATSKGSSVPILKLLRKYDGPYFFYLAGAASRRGGVTGANAYAVYKEYANVREAARD